MLNLLSSAPATAPFSAAFVVRSPSTSGGEARYTDVRAPSNGEIENGGGGSSTVRRTRARMTTSDLTGVSLVRRNTH